MQPDGGPRVNECRTWYTYVVEGTVPQFYGPERGKMEAANARTRCCSLLTACRVAGARGLESGMFGGQTRVDFLYRWEPEVEILHASFIERRPDSGLSWL